MNEEGLTPEEIKRSNDVAAAYTQQEQARGRRDTLKTILLALCAPSAASGWYMWARHPLIQERVEFIPITENGTIAYAFRLEDLPPEAREDMTFISIWNYVVLREQYSFGMAEKSWRIVSLMSDDRVKREYQELHKVTNPGSPSAIYGRDCVVSIDYESHADASPPSGYSGPPPGYIIRFRRTETWNTKPPVKEIWQCSVMFHRNVPKVGTRDKYEFNPASLLVWQYPPARPVSEIRRR